MLRRAGVGVGQAASAPAAATSLQVGTGLALPVLALPAILGVRPSAGFDGARLVSHWLPIPAGGLAYIVFSRRYPSRRGLRGSRMASARSPIRDHCPAEQSQAIQTNQEVHRWIRSSNEPGSWQGPS
jgi:hypothetical protein